MKNVTSKLNTTFKGKIAELKTEMRASELGMTISRPTTDARYDYVLDDGKKLHKIQVKYAGYSPSTDDNVVVVNLRKNNHNSHSKTRVYLESEIDALVVYILKTDQICWLPAKIFHGKMNINLRMDDPDRKCKNMILSKDYIW